jgi:hypothetical protein
MGRGKMRDTPYCFNRACCADLPADHLTLVTTRDVMRFCDLWCLLRFAVEVVTLRARLQTATPDERAAIKAAYRERSA